MNERIPPNRSELLKVKQKKKAAIKGHGLLKKKRDTLIRKFFELIKDYKQLKRETIIELNKSYKTLQKAQGVSGVNRVKSLSFSSKKAFDIKTSSSTLMGVKIPEYEVISYTPDFNASLIGVSSYVRNARDKFTNIISKMVKLAEIEQVIYKLAEEIKKTKRRVNSLKHIRIPGLEDSEKEIKDKLDEMERESFVILKEVKKKIGS